MNIALTEAKKAFKLEEIPVGAVLVNNKTEKIIFKDHNRKESQSNPLAHAEILVISESSRLLNTWRLTNSTLYVTMEPCIMCAGALINARIDSLVYGCSDPRFGGVESLYQILNDKRLNHEINVTKGVLMTECNTLLKDFFKHLRARKKLT